MPETETIPDQIRELIEEFLDTITPDDCGRETFAENNLLCYEGFSQECWNSAEERGMNKNDLEEEILSEWFELTQVEPIEHAFILDSDNLGFFYAIYKISNFKEKS